MSNTKANNTICLWFDKDAQDAARFYAATFPDSEVTTILKAPSDYPSGEESACGWCKDRWGISWQITLRVLMDALAASGAGAKRVFAAMMDMGKIDIAKIEAPRRG